jgi:hypothetical protein
MDCTVTAWCRARQGTARGDYSGWSLRDRLELLAFDARLAGAPQVLIAALWEALNLLESRTNTRSAISRTEPWLTEWLRGLN